jgi:hypothetical protein
MKPERKKTRGLWPLLAAAALLVALLAQPALADKYWVGPTTNNYWTNANNWSNTPPPGIPGAGQPGAGENVFLTQSDAINRTVLYNTALNLLYGNLQIDATGTGTMTLQKAFNPLRAANETVGINGTGHFIHGSGSNAITTNLILALNQNSIGTYDLNSGSLSASEEYIGNSGTGTFTQGSGANTLTNLFLGGNTGSLGTYNLNSGKLQAANETIGNSGTGTFNQYSGSTNTVNNQLTLGATPGSKGTYTQNSGNLSVGGPEYIGWSGTGNFTQFGGTHTVNNFLILGSRRVIGETPGSGAYNLKSGNLSAARNEVVGDFGTGIFNQTGGSNMVASNLLIGQAQGASGTYNLHSGKLTVGADEFIGNGGTGIFNHFGGIHTVTDTLFLAANPASSGTYNLMGGSLSVGTPFAGGADIQISPPGGGTGTFNVKNVTTTVNGDVLNNGTVKTTNANVTWNGNFTNNGAYISDPSTQTFNNNLAVGAPGYLVATHSQDLFVIKNDFINQSANALWNTVQAGLRFAPGADNMHNFYIPGLDNGPKNTNPFAWASLNINGQIINLFDGNGAAGGAQYVGKLIGANVSGGVVHNIFGDAASILNIYYDPTVAANFYLGGLTYNFAGGLGQLIPDDPVTSHTPLPPSAFLLGSGLLGLGLLGYRRRRLKG